MKKINLKILLSFLITSLLFVGFSAKAEKLDDIIKSGTLKCGVMLDFPPAGFRDKSNNPIGYDVEYCKDIAKSMGVKAVIVETASPQRLPAIISGQVDISIGSVTSTIERSKTVLFTNHYLVYKLTAMVKKGSSIKKWNDLAGKKVGVVLGTTPEIEYLKNCKAWSEGCKQVSYKSNADQMLAFKQGKVDAVIDASSIIGFMVNGAEGKDYQVGPVVPNFNDWISIAVPKGEYHLREFLDTHIFWTVDSGRSAEIYKKWFGGKAPALVRSDVNF